MRSFVTCTVLASVASLATAHVAARQPTFEYPEGVPALEKRQDPGTPRFLCHENCGTLITIGRTENYCDTEEWKTRYAACMVCANEFEIWQYYRSGVTSAASTCGLTPVPSPSGGASTPPSSTSAPAAVTTSETPAPPADEPTTTAAGVTTTAAGAVTTTPATSGAATSAASGASSAPTSAATTPAAGSSSATVTRVTSIGTSVVIPSGTPTTSVVFAGAARNSGILGAAGVVGLVLAAL